MALGIAARRPAARDAEVGQVRADGEPDHDEREVDAGRYQRTGPELAQEGEDPRSPGEKHVDAYREEDVGAASGELHSRPKV